MTSKCKNNFCLLLTVFMLFNLNTYAKDESSETSSNTFDSTSSVAETSSSSASYEDDFDEESSESDVTEDYSSTQQEDTSSESTTYSQSYNNSTSSYSSQTNSNQKSYSSSSSNSQKSSSTLLPKTKVDNSNELNSNDLQLVIDENTPKDFDFIQNSEEKNPGNVEWMKTLGIVFLLLACAGFIYTLLGLMSLRSSYKKKKIKR